MVFVNRPGDWGSLPGRVIPKIQKMVLDTSLLNTQHYKVRFKGKWEQSSEGVVAIEKRAFGVTLDCGRLTYLTVGLNLELSFS